MRLVKCLTLKWIGLVAVFATVFSFSPDRAGGGEYYEIYLNKKLLLSGHVSSTTENKSLQLDNANSGTLEVYYNHCGTIGKSRHITIRNENNKDLKVWKFADTGKDNKFMSVNVQDVLHLQKKSDRLGLYYTSAELPKGKKLASITFNSEKAAAK